MLFDRQVEIAKMNYTHAVRPSLRSSQKEQYQICALKKAGLKQIDTPALPEEPGLHRDYTTGDRHGHEAIKLSIWKTTWIQDAQSGILQVRRCTSYLKPR